ncbi:hypothetical protein EUTSA_v10009833mg, partial [Eutrema salsugineum]
YYITLTAYDPASGSHLPLQVHVDEDVPNYLALTVSVARPKGDSGRTRELISTMEPLSTLLVDEPPVDKLPEWPSEDAFSVIKRFYLVEESELQHNDWILLYLQLQFFYLFMYTVPAIVYITFKGLAIRGMSDHFEWKAIVRRLINERT